MQKKVYSRGNNHWHDKLFGLVKLLEEKYDEVPSVSAIMVLKTMTTCTLCTQLLGKTWTSFADDHKRIFMVIKKPKNTKDMQVLVKLIKMNFLVIKFSKIQRFKV